MSEGSGRIAPVKTICRVRQLTEDLNGRYSASEEEAARSDQENVLPVSAIFAFSA